MDIQKKTKPINNKASKHHRVYLVIVDDTEEFDIALRFTCKRICKSGGGISLLHVIEHDNDFHHWAGVAELMRHEMREEAEKLLATHSQNIYEATGKMPTIHIREGSQIDELFALLKEEKFSVVVLAANTKGDSPGPIISQAISYKGLDLHVPFIIVPGNLSDDEIEALT